MERTFDWVTASSGDIADGHVQYGCVALENHPQRQNIFLSPSCIWPASLSIRFKCTLDGPSLFILSKYSRRLCVRGQVPLCSMNMAFQIPASLQVGSRRLLIAWRSSELTSLRQGITSITTELWPSISSVFSAPLKRSTHPNSTPRQPGESAAALKKEQVDLGSTVSMAFARFLMPRIYANFYRILSLCYRSA
jgi:hypothetical protein